jgi:hypothetical protein
MWIEVPVITNLVCALTFPVEIILGSTICTSGEGIKGACSVSYAQCLRYRRINFANS